MDRYGRVQLTNPDKVLYPATGTTKAEVFDYYVNIADVMVAHIAGRPATRKRWPNGVDEPSFFEKQLASSAPDWLDRGTIVHKSGTTTYPIIDSRRGLGLDRRSRPRSRCTCRSGASSARQARAGHAAWCSTWTPARA